MIIMIGSIRWHHSPVGPLHPADRGSRSLQSLPVRTDTQVDWGHMALTQSAFTHRLHHSATQRFPKRGTHNDLGHPVGDKTEKGWHKGYQSITAAGGTVCGTGRWPGVYPNPPALISPHFTPGSIGHGNSLVALAPGATITHCQSARPAAAGRRTGWAPATARERINTSRLGNSSTTSSQKHFPAPAQLPPA